MNGPPTLAHDLERSCPMKVDSAVETHRRWWSSALRRAISCAHWKALEMNQRSPLVKGEMSPPIDPLDEVNGAEREGCEKALKSSVRSNKYGR